MSVLIFDSNGELWHTRAEELGLDYISMPYYIGGQECFYDLGKETDFRKFYDAVRGGEIPKTQALNPEDYKRILTPYFEKGEDRAVCFFLASAQRNVSVLKPCIAGAEGAVSGEDVYGL